jgi:hypothetical protein
MGNRDMNAEQELDRFVEEFFRSEHKARPVDATFQGIHTYDHLMGKLEILRIRDKYRTLRGETFDLREFHQKLLSIGIVPPKIVEMEMLT